MTCKHCPFRADSQMGYDEDAMECLDAGEEPACHAVVGPDRVFAHAPLSRPRGTECKGHDLWVAGAPGYRMPAPALE